MMNAPATSTDSAPTALIKIDDLMRLVLQDGLPVEQGGKTIRYRTAKLRETTVADERRAEALAERAVMAGGAWRLLVSESAFKHALNMMHIEAFECDGQELGRGIIDLSLYDKLSAADLALIEARIFLITLAAELRYGNISQAEFDAVIEGTAAKPLDASPQHTRQAGNMGHPGDPAVPGAELLADFTRSAAQSAPGGAGTPAV